MKKKIVLVLLLVIAAHASEAGTWTQWVNPFVGTSNQDGLLGNTFPGASMPFGMVQLSPDTRVTPSWDCASGYHYEDKEICGFSHTRLSGTGVSDLIDILLMPMVKGDDLSPKSAFSHQEEKAAPGYYQVRLQNGDIQAELAATTRVGIHRYTYSQGTDRYILLDLDHSALKGDWNRRVVNAQIRQVSPTVIEGYRLITGWAKIRKVYFRMELSQPMAQVQLYKDHRLMTGTPVVNGEHLKAVIRLDQSDRREVMVKLALSAVSPEGARGNMQAEASGWDFNQYVTAADREWNALLGKIEVEGKESDKRVFYTALYHTFLQPNTMSDCDGSYMAADYTIRRMPRGNTFYSTFSLWDTYRAAHPLYQLLIPERNADFVECMLMHHECYGYLPIWQLWGQENYCMIGNHAIPVVVDAVMRGSNRIDAERAYRAVKESSMRSHLNSPFDVWDRYGYMPEDIQTQSVSITLEMAFNDWCVATLAQHLGYADDAAYFMKRSQYYRALYNPANGFFQARKADGSWLEPFDPLRYGANGGNPYTEGNAWQWKWYVPHDVDGLVTLMGGKKAMAQQLDRFFTLTDNDREKNSNASGFVGQYIHGNEPDHHAPYLYNALGLPRKTQEMVQHICRTFYQDKPAGLPGNDDCGELSSWYVFSALGFYPVNPASGEYAVTTPLFNRAIIHLPNGNKLTIEAERKQENQQYIGSMRWNGKAMKAYTINYENIVKGGTWYIKCVK